MSQTKLLSGARHLRADVVVLDYGCRSDTQVRRGGRSQRRSSSPGTRPGQPSPSCRAGLEAPVTRRRRELHPGPAPIRGRFLQRPTVVPRTGTAPNLLPEGAFTSQGDPALAAVKPTTPTRADKRDANPWPGAETARSGDRDQSSNQLLTPTAKCTG